MGKNTQNEITDVTAESNQSSNEDLARQLYNSPENGFLLARTFRSGTTGGLETELAYLENAPGYIFANPTTVLSQNFPSKTISQTPGSDWSGQPSLLFSVQPQKSTTIANYGIASLNSFNTTEALNLMNKFAAIEQKTNHSLTLSEKMQNLQSFLKTNWTVSINSLKKQLETLENKVYPVTPDKTFYKPFNLFFHAKEDYDALLFSLESLYNNLAQAHNLCNLTIDVDLKPHPVAVMIEEHAKSSASNSPTNSDDGLTSDEDISPPTSPSRSPQSFKQELETTLDDNPNQLTIERVNRLKSLLIRAVGEYKHASLQEAPNSPRKSVDSVYDEYSNYLDNGARHNELVSRLYPWEITGIEWGASEGAKIHAVTSLIFTTKRRESLCEQFNEQGIEHPLFTDFMMNKLSVENPSLVFDDVKKLLSSLKKNQPNTLEITLDEIKTQLQRPISIYEYSATNRTLINISELVATNKNNHNDVAHQHTSPYHSQQSKEDLKLLKKLGDCKQVFALGLADYQSKFEDTNACQNILGQ